MNKWPFKLLGVLVLIVVATIILSYLQSPHQINTGIKLDRTTEYYNLLRAISALDSGKNREAIDICTAILRSNPYSEGACRLLARSYLREGDFLEAENILQKSLSWSNGSATLNRELGEVFIAQNKAEHAILMLERSYNLDSTAPRTILLLIELYREKGEHGEAKIWERRLEELKK